MDQPPAANQSNSDTTANQPSFPPQTEGGSLGSNPPAPAEELLLQDQPSPITTSPPPPPVTPLEPPAPPPQSSSLQQPEFNELPQNPSDESGGPKASAWFNSRIALALIIIILAGGLVFGISLIFQRKSSESVVTPPAQVAQVAKPLTLLVESPTDGTIVTNGEVLVRGKTSPNTLVVFYTDNNDNSVESDSSGNFEGKLAMNQGVNTLTVTATNTDGDEKTAVLDVVYDQE